MCYESAVRRREQSGGMRSGWRAAVATLFVVALALRLLYLHQLSASPLGQVLLGDGLAYDAWARRIAAGDWWGSEVFYQAPLYPYVLAVVYAVASPAPLAARLFQALLGAATCGLAAAAGRRWFDARSGLAAGALLALYPPAIFFDGEIQKASLTLFLATALVWLLARRDEPPRPGWCLATGALTGLFALNRENALLLVPLLALWLLAVAGGGRRGVWRNGAASAALLVAGALAVLLPVALRNRAIGGELLLTTAQLGPNFYIGNHAGADGRYQPLVPGHGSARYERADATALAERSAGRELTPAEVSRYWTRRALADVRDEPGRWLALLARKGFLVWNRLEIVDTTSLEAAADSSWLLAGLSRLLHFGVLCPLAAAGVWLTRRRRRELAVLYLMVGAWAVAVAAFFVFARYRLPMVPILALFAGAGIAGAGAAVRDRRLRALLRALAVALATALAVNWPADDRDPRVPTYANLGVALGEAGRRDEGIAQLERAVALSPGFAEAHLALGHLRAENGDLAGAGAAYARVTELDPASAPAWNGLGLLAAGRGEREEALRCFRRAVAADATHVESRFNLARTLSRAGDLGGAREHYARLVLLAPADAEAREELADLLAFGNEFAAAVAEYERVVALAPDRAFAHFKLALARDRLAGPAAAAGDLARALALEPGYAARLLAAAAAEESAGRPLAAERLYRLLLAAGPHPEAERRLATLAKRSR
jgi:4-amino-4-deoxy-L-arabinose transferase-like glycosyltransferase/predicted TPR repeat methyltransferase